MFLIGIRFGVGVCGFGLVPDLLASPFHPIASTMLFTIMEDCEVARNGKGDEDPEDPQTINEVCVAISALIIVENLTQ